RLLALLLLVAAFKKSDARQRARIYRVYRQNTRHINSWDLVDASAHHIMGDYLFRRCREPLYRLAASPVMWERRIAVIATWHFIGQGDYADTLRIADMLLADREDLIHKAVGWMLREIGKRDEETAHAYLKAHCCDMPRTMLRYAIERFPEHLRRKYLRGAI
ncbi:MAG: DNA alkylation repair protein, partial [Deltaproteobacteria bacterium]|nr:DNA alkylation repair protein [Deltaproteobacteria bacterium]